MLVVLEILPELAGAGVVYVNEVVLAARNDLIFVELKTGDPATGARRKSNVSGLHFAACPVPPRNQVGAAENRLPQVHQTEAGQAEAGVADGLCRSLGGLERAEDIEAGSRIVFVTALRAQIEFPAIFAHGVLPASPLLDGLFQLPHGQLEAVKVEQPLPAILVAVNMAFPTL